LSTALIGTNLITGDGQVIEQGAVKIEGDRIVEVGANGDITADRYVDLEGRTLMPGMIDVHVHMIGGDKAFGFGDEATTFRMYEPLPKALLDGVEAAKKTLHAGVTSVREIAARDYLDVFLKQAQLTGQVQGPRMLATGPGVFMTGGHGSFLEPGHEADGVDGMIRRVRELVANKVDVIKIVSADGPETLGKWWTAQTTREEAVACFTEARRLGRQTASHAMGAEAITNVVLAGVDTVEHGWYLDEASCNLMIEHGTTLVGTLSNVIAIIHNGPNYFMPWAEMMAADEEAIFERHTMAVELGTRIAMGSDCGGNEAHRHGQNALELECYVRCGMSPMQAITSATLEGARVLRMDDQVGTIEAGKLADLVVIDGNPLDDIGLTRRGVTGVIQGGQVVRDDLGILDELRHDHRLSNALLAPQPTY
jgi:imidazolonepropionase-like amidohydrolase